MLMTSILTYPLLSIPGSLLAMGIPITTLAMMALMALGGAASRRRWLVALAVLIAWALLRAVTGWGAVALSGYIPLILIPAAWTAAAVGGLWAAWQMYIRLLAA